MLGMCCCLSVVVLSANLLITCYLLIVNCAGLCMAQNKSTYNTMEKTTLYHTFNIYGLSKVYSISMATLSTEERLPLIKQHTMTLIGGKGPCVLDGQQQCSVSKDFRCWIMYNKGVSCFVLFIYLLGTAGTIVEQFECCRHHISMCMDVMENAARYNEGSKTHPTFVVVENEHKMQ
jgi:hypothetical protein